MAVERTTTIINFDSFRRQSTGEFLGLFAPKIKFIADNADAILNAIQRKSLSQSDLDIKSSNELIESIQALKSSTVHGYMTGTSEKEVLTRLGVILGAMEQRGVPTPPEVPEDQINGFYSKGALEAITAKEKDIFSQRMGMKCTYDKKFSMFEKLMPYIGQVVSWMFGIGAAFTTGVWMLSAGFSVPFTLLISGAALWSLRLDKYSAVDKHKLLAQHIRRSWSGVYAEYPRIGTFKHIAGYVLAIVMGTFLTINTAKMLGDGFNSLVKASKSPFIAIVFAAATTWHMIVSAVHGIWMKHEFNRTITQQPVKKEDLEKALEQSPASQHQASTKGVVQFRTTSEDAVKEDKTNEVRQGFRAVI